MAKGKGESVGGLYIRLGLSYDELNQDFVNVEQTLSENIQRLNRENKLVRLKAEIDLTGVTDAAEKLKVQQQALTRQIEIQREKVKLYESEWMAASKANDAASKQAQSAAIALKQQQLELARLSQQLKETSAQLQSFSQQEAEAARSDKSLLGRYNSIKGDVGGQIGRLASAFQGLRDAAGSADGAITKALDIIDAIPSPVGKAVAALASIPLVVKGIENSLLELAKPAVSAGDSFYAMARGLQMSMADAAKFNMICKVTGIEVSEVVNTTKRLQSQIVKAGKDGNTLTKALERYGVEARTASGELKDAFEMSVALAEGLQRAQALGESRQFIASLGRGITGDYITYLEDLLGPNGNIGLAASVVKNGLADPALAHSIQGNMNAMNAQAEQLSGAFSSAFMPIANVIVPQITARMGELVKIIENNADAIKDVGFAIADVVTVIGEATTAVIKFGLESAKYLTNPNRISINGTLARYKDDADEIKSFNDFIEKELQRLSKAERILIESSPQQLAAFKNQRVAAYAKLKEAYESAAEARKKAEEEAAAARNKLEWKAPFTDEEFQESLDRIKKIKEETSRIQLDLQFRGDNYGKARAELDLWYKQAIEASNGFVQERRALDEEYAAKSELIEKDRADKLDEIRESIAAGDRTALENKLANLEKEKQAWISAGMEEAEATELAERKRQQIMEEVSQRVQSLIQEAANIEYHATHTSIENQRYDIEQWKQAKLEQAETAEEVTAIIALAAAKERQIVEESLKRASDLTRETAAIEYHMTHDSLENQIYDIQRWRDEKLEQAATAEEAAAIIANAEAKESAAIKQEIDRSLERADSLNRATAAMTYHAAHEAFENQLYDIEQWKEAQLEKATTAEEVAATIANAAAKEADAFESEMDRIQGKMESAQDRLARLKLSQRDYDIYRAQKQYEKDLEELPRVLADAIYSAELSKIGRDTERANLQRRLKTANDSNRDWIQKQLDSLNLGYTDTPRQRYKSLGDAGDMLNAFQERLKFAEPLLTVNAKNYAKFKAQQELDRFQKSFPAATAKFTDVSDIFNGQLLSATASVTDFDKAIKHATGGLRGGNTSAGESTQGYQNLRELFRDGKNGRFPIVYLDELSKEVASLGSGTREALNKILDKAPEGVDVSPIRDLINNQIIRPQALGDAMLGLSDDLKAQLSTALTEGEKTSDMRSSEAMINSMANLAEKMQNAIETIETAKNDISTAAESVKGSNENLSGSLNQVADKVNGLREALANLPTRQNPDSQQQNAPDMSALTQELQNQSGILGEIKAAIQELPQQLSQSISETNQENTQALSEQFQQISQSISEITQGISQAAAEIGEQLSQSASDIGEKISQLLTDTTQQFSQTISETSQQITQSFSETIQQAGQSLAEAINQIPQQATETANQIVQSISETSQQLTQTLSEISQGLSQSLSEATQSVIQAIAEQTNQMVQALGVVSQAMAESARALTESRASQNQRSAPNVSSTVNNNINLGGAYVFDNSMKRQLTDDIASEVANAVTSAVSSFESRSSYGYATL